jgi:hypothetical protein
MAQSYQTIRLAQPLPLAKFKKATIVQNQQPIISYNSIVGDDDSNNNKKQTSYTITRTYVAPNGTTKTKSIEYHGDEAKKVILIYYK